MGFWSNRKDIEKYRIVVDADTPGEWWALLAAIYSQSPEVDITTEIVWRLPSYDEAGAA